MSRNLRQKQPPPRKAARRGSDSSSSLNLSDEDGYSGVEDVSDSEDEDEEDVNAAEEEHILLDEVHPKTRPPRPQVAQDEDGDEDDDDENEDDDNEEDAAVDAEDSEDDVEDEGDDSASWDGIVSDTDEPSPSHHYAVQRTAPPVERHVRFDVPSSESDSTDTEDDHADFFPDIFVEQSSLDPAFRRELELDDGNDDSSNSGSFWDYHGGNDLGSDVYPAAVIQELDDEETPVQTPIASQASVLSSEAHELDGYETDGDTTEDDVPEPLVKRKMRRSTPREDSSGSETDQPSKFRKGQPRVGRFNLDSSERKPIAVVNPISRKMMIFTTHRRRQLDLSPEQFNLQMLPPLEDASPMLSNSAQIMMSAMFSSNTFGDYLNTQPIGPAEAFFPFPSDGPTPDESSDLGFDDEEEEDVEEKHLDISDFITWEDEGASSADDEAEENEWTEGDDLMSTPCRPTTATSEADDHAHINPSTVGAFRRDQINQKLVLSSKATYDSLALSSPYNYTTLRGLKSDRFETAAVPLTPLRRKKRSSQDMLRSPLETAAQKRKASAEHAYAAHKRQRSISDVNLLQI